jgi:single-strand DNA-binding protein
MSRRWDRGRRALVAGKLIERTFEQDGVKRTVVEIVASHVAADLTFATAEITKPEREKRPA